MIYPVILVGLALCMVIFMLTFILPKITDSFKKTNTEIPGLTQFMMNLSDFLIGNWPILIVALVGFALFYIFFLKKTYI